MLEQHKRIILGLLLAAWVLYSAFFWSKALFFDKAGNLVAGHVNIWGDWAAHMTMGNAMAERGLFLSSSPLLIGQPFAYPFVSNMVSSILLKTGLPLITSYALPSFIFASLFVVALFWFYLVVFKSRGVAIIASCIFIFNGGTGFYYFVQDVLKSDNPVATILSPAHEYTRLDSQNIKWINVIDSMIIPQRAFTLGFPLALVALGLIYQSTFSIKAKQATHTKTIAAGLIIGLLPIIHTHSFLAVFIILTFWSITDLLFTWYKTKKANTVLLRTRYWAMLLIIVTTLALPLIKIFLSQNVSEAFIQWYPGWLAKEFKMNWVVFWFKNWSITPFIALMSWAVLFDKNKKNKQWPYIFAPFFGIFIAANLWLFQPFSWDNTKLIVWSSLGFSGVVAHMLYQMWQYSTKKSTSIRIKSIIRITIFCLLFSITASGLLDAYYIAKHDLHSHIMFSKEEVDLANWAKENTDKESIWLTGDQHNHWVFVLTGRQALMAYRGWLWTHGYDYRGVESAVSQMYTNPEQTTKLFNLYKVDYIVVGPNERTVWHANELALERKFTVLKRTKNYTIFATQLSNE